MGTLGVDPSWRGGLAPSLRAMERVVLVVLLVRGIADVSALTVVGCRVCGGALECSRCGGSCRAAEGWDGT